MNDKLFVIAIGGTGMRCLEAFVHLCAAGMFDNQEIEILTLDTDQSNGNKSRVEGLIDLYNKVKTNDTANPGGNPNANTFFSAKLNLYKFFTDYSTNQRKNYKVLSLINSGTQEQKQDNQDLADLLLDRDTVQDFDLDHGYRAQTHLGSMLMYHGIVEAARNAKIGGKDVKDHEKALEKFLQLMQKNSGNARVFIFGSVFGGTGASSIPVVPIALRDAVNLLSDGSTTFNLDQVKFGSTLLTDYFMFKRPDDQQRKAEHVIADANNFALNSQAALQFYISDPTVKNFYKRLYHIGWPSSQRLDLTDDSATGVVTGGRTQENPAHIVELMSACAAYDFFTSDIKEKQATYLYRCVELDDNDKLRLTGASFVDDSDKFENRLGALFSLAHVILSKHNGAYGSESGDGVVGLLDRFAAQGITDYNTITDEQAKEIDDYFRQFAYKVAGGKLKKGWMYQLKDTVPGSFIFNNDAFRTDPKEISRIDPGRIFTDDRHNWNHSLINNRYDTFIKGLVNTGYEDKQNVSTIKEQFMAHLYNAITEAQHYN